MHIVSTHLPIVKASDVQKNFKKVAEEVKKDGFRFVLNRGNVDVVIISIPLYTEKFGSPPPRRKEKKPFADWKKKTWKQILKELRASDRKKTDEEFIKALLEWQEKDA